MNALYRIMILIPILLFTSCEDSDKLIRPQALSGVEATTAIGSIRLKWDIPQGDIRKYIITYNPGDGLINIENTSTTEYTLEGLRENVTYTVNVSWLNTSNIRSLPYYLTATTLAKEGEIVIVHEGNLDLLSQADVDALSLKYTSVTGRVRIKGNVSDISILSNLKTIGANLEVDATTLLTNLDALSNLQRIGNNCWIRNNAMLVSIEGLHKLNEVATNLYVRTNPVLTSLKGLEGLSTLQEIYVETNVLLTDFCALKPVFALLPNVKYSVKGNAANPTIEEIASLNCNP